MATELEVREELKTLAQKYEWTLTEAALDDYARIGAYLSRGPNEPKLLGALASLETALCAEVRRVRHDLKSEEEARGIALAFFDQRLQTHEKQVKGGEKIAEKKGDFAGLLHRTLGDIEDGHGFNCDRKPLIYGYIISQQQFLAALARKQHWKDLGAGSAHGPHTHRIQWHLITEPLGTPVIRSEPPLLMAKLFAAIGNFPAPNRDGDTLWDRLCDRSNLLSEGTHDFRRPEHFHAWLKSKAGAAYPLLHCLLQYQAVRAGPFTPNYTYLSRKTGLPKEQLEKASQVYEYDASGKKYVSVPA